MEHFVYAEHNFIFEFARRMKFKVLMKYFSCEKHEIILQIMKYCSKVAMWNKIRHHICESKYFIRLAYFIAKAISLTVRRISLHQKKNDTLLGVAFFGARDGTGRLRRLRLAYYPLGDPNPTDFGTRLPLLAKNSPPDCFLNAQTLSGPSPVFIITKKWVHTEVWTHFWCECS